MQVVYLAIDFRKHKWEGGESEVGKGGEALKDVLMSTLLLGATGVQTLPPPTLRSSEEQASELSRQMMKKLGCFSQGCPSPSS